MKYIYTSKYDRISEFWKNNEILRNFLLYLRIFKYTKFCNEFISKHLWAVKNLFWPFREKVLHCLFFKNWGHFHDWENEKLESKIKRIKLWTARYNFFGYIQFNGKKIVCLMNLRKLLYFNIISSCYTRDFTLSINHHFMIFFFFFAGFSSK